MDDREEMSNQLCRIAKEVFLLMTEIELSPCAAPAAAVAGVAARLCYVTPAGKELQMVCEPALASAAAKHLMSLHDLPDVADDRVQDSIFELTNMVGGNFHGILSPGSALDTTPQAVHGDVEDMNVQLEAHLRGVGGILQLRLMAAAQGWCEIQGRVP